MSATSLATVIPPPEAPAVTGEQLDLIRRTIAKDATPDELKLYLFDCARQGVHPLDKLVHFTKRSGKYTPVTSIDFMRIRAADSGEMAGSDDAVFTDGASYPVAASVTVYRLTRGQRFAYTATARWSEYKPESDFMWRKMPHTMLAKCAEALALRKGFPRQLAGLYAKEEMDQADEPKGYTVAGVTVTNESTSIFQTPGSKPPSIPMAGEGEPKDGAAATRENRGTSDAPLPPGCVYIERVDLTDTANPNIKRALVTTSTGEQFTTVNTALMNDCEGFANVRVPVRLTTNGERLLSATRVEDTSF